MQRQHVSLEIHIELIAPGVPLFHVERYGAWSDLWLTCDRHGRLRTLSPVRGLDAHSLTSWQGDWPPLAQIVAGAIPDLFGAVR